MCRNMGITLEEREELHARLRSIRSDETGESGNNHGMQISETRRSL